MNTSLLMALLTAAVPIDGNATLPLSQFMVLMDAPRGDAPDASRGVVTHAALTGRPGEAGLWVEASFTVNVAGSSPVPVPLLVAGDDVVVSELSSDNALATVVDGVVTAYGQSGANVVTIKALVRSRRSGPTATATLQLTPNVPPVPMKLTVDDGLFKLTGATVVREWGGYVVFPARNRYSVGWAVQPEVIAMASAPRRTPMDPVVTLATSRWVSTLEGRALHTVTLQLQLDRPGVLEVEVPASQVLVQAKVNGMPAAIDVAQRSVSLAVSPTSLGGASGTVELTLRKELGIFHLSGDVSLEAPKVSWPINKFTTEAVLPQVFTYTREGGSMKLDGITPDAVTGDVPGTSLRFTQHLISSSAPVVALRYSVDISQRYFR